MYHAGVVSAQPTVLGSEVSLDILLRPIHNKNLLRFDHQSEQVHLQVVNTM